jgi:hypothetical protein
MTTGNDGGDGGTGPGRWVRAIYTLPFICAAVLLAVLALGGAQ